MRTRVVKRWNQSYCMHEYDVEKYSQYDDEDSRTVGTHIGLSWRMVRRFGSEEDARALAKRLAEDRGADTETVLAEYGS